MISLPMEVIISRPNNSDTPKGRYSMRETTSLSSVCRERIISPFLRHMTLTHYKLTPKELRVANLVKEGKTNKEIADLLHLSIRSVEFHRDNIREKLGLKNKKANLQSFLLSLR